MFLRVRDVSPFMREQIQYFIAFPSLPYSHSIHFCQAKSGPYYKPSFGHILTLFVANEWPESEREMRTRCNTVVAPSLKGMPHSVHVTYFCISWTHGVASLTWITNCLIFKSLNDIQVSAKERLLICKKVLPVWVWLVLSTTGPYFCKSLYLITIGTMQCQKMIFNWDCLVRCLADTTSKP